MNQPTKISAMVSEAWYSNKEFALKCLPYFEDKSKYPTLKEVLPSQVKGRYTLEPLESQYDQMAFGVLPEITLEDLFHHYLLRGYAACHVFDNFNQDETYKFVSSKGSVRFLKPYWETGRNAGYMNISFKSERFFTSASFVVVDIDYTDAPSMKDFYYSKKLDKKPTGALLSYSNGVDNPKHGGVSARFHLYYVLKEPITSFKEYARLSKAIRKYLNTVSPGTDTDPKLDSAAQYFNGYYITKQSDDAYILNEDYVYSPEDFAEWMDAEVVEDTVDMNMSDEWKEMLQDYDQMTYRSFVNKWSKKYNLFYESPKPDFGGQPYIQRPDDYYRIHLRKKGDRIKDGQHRRHTLTLYGHIRRAIMPEITPEHLLYTLLIDAHQRFDNYDEALCTECVAGIAKTVIEEPLSEAIEAARKFQPSIIYNTQISGEMHDELVSSSRSSATTESNFRRGQKTAEIISANYNRNFSLRDNVEAFKELGIVPKICGERTIRRWCKDNNINPKNK